MIVGFSVSDNSRDILNEYIIIFILFIFKSNLSNNN